jgi:hypothetical protein
VSNTSELGQLIDCTEEEFRKFCEDKDLGYISSFHNLMVQTFNEVHKLKNELVEKMCKSVERSPEEQNVLNGIYSKLMRIEQRVFILREIIKTREIKS